MRLRVIAGHAFDLVSPVRVHSPTLYVEVHMAAGSRLVVPPEHAERACYVLGGALQVDGAVLPPARMLVIDSDAPLMLQATSAVHLFLCGGAPLDGERVMWWNFVALDRARIEQAKADWRAQRQGQVPGETEFIPLPDA